MDNPFSLNFGREPNLYIPRLEEQEKITSTFNSDNPYTNVFMIVGARGSGKTVLMSEISHSINSMPNWIHIDLNVERDLLNALAANLYNKTKKNYPKIKLDISIKGLGISLEREEKYTDIQLDLDKMLEALSKKKVRVLITLDEVVNSKGVREFTTYFQHCIREGLPVFLLMTGLYKNVRALQNNRSQTFLRRTPKIELEPLNLRRIALKYREVFSYSEEESMKVADMTAGYSYGFQILGYHLYESKERKLNESVVTEYRISLEENSYEKIWEELSLNERLVAGAIAEHEGMVSVKVVREKLDMDSNNFSTYQSVLEGSGILKREKAYGILEFALPYFREFVISKMK